MDRYIRIYKPTIENEVIWIDRITQHSTLTIGNSNDFLTQLEVCVPTSEVTNNATEVSRATDQNNRVRVTTKGIIRIIATRNVDTILTLSDGISLYQFSMRETGRHDITNSFGSFKWQVNSTQCFLRINALNDGRDLFLYVQDISTTLGIVSSSVIPLAIDSIRDEDAVIFSHDLKTMLFKNKNLPASQSARWNLHSTAGMSAEYYCVERHYQETGNLIGTLGSDFVSYRENLTHNQYESKLSTAYNKSNYGEAQIRVWGASSSQYIKIKYKNYTTGIVYEPEDAPLEYKGVVTFNYQCLFTSHSSSIEQLDGYKRVRFNDYTSKLEYAEYIVSEKIKCINVKSNDFDIQINENTPVYVDEDGTVCGTILQGVIIHYIKSDRDMVLIKVFSVSQDVEINIIKQAVIDRTQEDVDRVKELTTKVLKGTATEEELLEWNSDLKGALNRSDLIRIVYNCTYLAKKLGIEIISQTIPELPTLSWYQVLLTNIQTLVSGYIVHPDTPTTPTIPLNTYQKWNDIEKILYDINDILEASITYYCGDDLIANDNFII